MSASENKPTFGFENRMERRVAIKWMLTAAASVSLAHLKVRGAQASAVDAKGYGTDPVLAKTYNPGEIWPLTLTDSQRRTATVLCDTIIPEDGSSPSASSVGVVDFIDEWVSAPYPQQRRDRPTLLEGLDWIEEEAQRRYSKSFASLSETQLTAICDDICLVSAAKPNFKKAAAFFALYRDLTAGGFYSTPEGSKDLNYIGNVPLDTFPGPSAEIIRRVGLS